VKDKSTTSTQNIFEHHHCDMFNSVLDRVGLKFAAEHPPLRLDLMSLRRTYIRFWLMDGVGIWDIAANCRTSVTMIEQHYARWLNQLLANINAGPLSRFGAEDLETPLKKPSKTTKKSAKTPDTDAPDEGPLAKKPPKTIRKPVAPKTVSG